MSFSNRFITPYRASWGVWKQFLKSQQTLTKEALAGPQSSILNQYYFCLWQLIQLCGSFVLKAKSPLWHFPHHLPLFISAIVIFAAPFFCSKVPWWQSMHWFPLSKWVWPENVTVPMGCSHVTSMPGGTAKTEPNPISKKRLAMNEIHALILLSSSTVQCCCFSLVAATGVPITARLR